MGIDISKEMVEEASKNVNDKKVEFKIGGSGKIDQLDNSVDVVVSENAFDCVVDLANILEECYRALKDGGKLIFLYYQR